MRLNFVAAVASEIRDHLAVGEIAAAAMGAREIEAHISKTIDQTLDNTG